MIVTDFYPTLTTIGDDMLITDTVTAQHVTDKEADPAKPYYMGEVDPDYSLLRSGTFKAEKSGEDISTYSYKFEQDMSAKAKWLYMTSNVGNYLYFNYLNGRWDSNYKFFNGFAPNKMNMLYTTQLTLNLRLYDFVNEHTLGNGEHVFTNNSTWDKTINLSGNVLYEFFEEGLTYNTNINGVQYQLRRDNYDDDEHCWHFDNGMRIYITSAYINVTTASSMYYSNNYIMCSVINSIPLPEDGGYHNYNDEAIDRPESTVFIDATYFSPSDNRLDLNTHKFGFKIGLYNDPSLYVYNGGKVVLRGGAPFEISYIAANYAASSNQDVVTSNGALLHATGQQTLRVNHFVDLPSIYHSGWGNHPKHVTSRDKDGNEISGYNSNTSQYEKYDDVPIFGENNVFMFRVKENKYKDLEPQLHDWQKYGSDISDNEYDPDDGGGGGGDSGDPDDANDPSKEDGIDEGDPNAPDWYSSNYSMTKFVNLNATGWADLMTNLQQAIIDTVNNPSDTTKLGYLLGTFKSDGTYECADDLAIFKFIASARWYPFDVSALYGDGYYVVNQTPEAALTFGYRGASIACSNKRVDWPIAALDLVRIIVPNKKGTTDINDCTFEDFEPYTKYTLMLPFVGELAIPAHNAVCATLMIKYLMDFSSGTCCAVVYASGGFNSSGGDGATCLGVLSGQCSTSVSIAGNDVVAQGDQIASATLNKASTELSLARSKFDFGLTIAKSSAEIAGGALVGDEAGAALAAAKTAPGIIHSAMDIASNNISDKMASIQLTQAQRSVPFCMNWGSNVTGNLVMKTPTLRIERSLVIRPENYKHVYGYPTCKQFNLSGVKGYFQCANPDISGIGSTGTVPTEAEQQMINEALRSGSFMGDG